VPAAALAPAAARPMKELRFEAFAPGDQATSVARTRIRRHMTRRKVNCQKEGVEFSKFGFSLLLEPFRPDQSREQINEQEQRHNRGYIDHGCCLTSYIFSQPSRNRKHNTIAIIPRKNIAGSQIARFIRRPSSHLPRASDLCGRARHHLAQRNPLPQAALRSPAFSWEPHHDQTNAAGIKKS
jgi:hypothetical protein